MFASVTSAGARTSYYLNHTTREIRKHFCNYCLGFCSTLLVVVSIAVALSALANANIVFLGLAEADSGQIDLKIKNEQTTLNYTQISEIIESDPMLAEIYKYSSPRLELSPHYWREEDCESPFTVGIGSDWAYDGFGGSDDCAANPNDVDTSCLTKYCGEKNQVDLIIVDFDELEAMETGRSFPLWGSDSLPLAAGKAFFVPTGTVSDVAKGDAIWLHHPIWSVLGPTWEYAKAEIPGPAGFGRHYFRVEIEEVLTQTWGLSSEARDRPKVFLDYDSFWPLIFDSGDPVRNAETTNFLKSLNMRHYAQEITFNLPPEPSRTAFYTNPDFDAVQKDVTGWAANLVYRLGFDQLPDNELSILPEFADLNVFSLFFGLLLNIIIVVLIFLSVILIYSLLMISVETRQFEVGVLRMVGMKRSRIVVLLFVQAMFFAIPSTVVGLGLSAWLWSGLANVIATFAQVPVPTSLDLEAVLVAIALGMGVPIVSSIIPIRAALTQNLHDALDAKRGKSSITKLSIERADESNINWTFLVAGLMLSVLGFFIYYLFPLALLSFNFGLLLNIFLFLLLGMLFGLTLLSFNIQHLTERLIVNLFLFLESRSVKSMVSKNLIAHRERNRKTNIMYALSLGFILFISVSYTLQIQTTVWAEQRDLGTLLAVQARNDFNEETGTINFLSRETVIRLESLALNHTIIEDWSWTSSDLHDFITDSEIETTNIGHAYGQDYDVAAAAPNFFEVMTPGFLVFDDGFEPKSWEESESYVGISELMYTAQGSQGAILSTGSQDSLLLDMDSNFIVESSFQGTFPNFTRMAPLAFLSSAPYHDFSQFPGSDGTVLVSWPTFVRLSNGHIDSVDDIPIRTFFIKLSSSATDGELDSLVSDLLLTIEDEGQNARIRDFRRTGEPIEVANTVVNGFLTFTLVVILCVCFFSLTSSMFSNIAEQSKEIAILRALGSSRASITRIYVWEAFIIVFSSSIMGIIIGSLIAYTFTIQRAVFTQLPIPFSLPWALTAFVCALAFVFAILAAFGPIRRLLRQTVVETLRT